MTQQHAPPSRAVDPWAAFGRLVAGVGIYSTIGWVGDSWIGTSFLVPVGIVIGAALGLWTTFLGLRQQ
jgi:F0F1-type ATP synthase assembly protein I